MCCDIYVEFLPVLQLLVLGGVHRFADELGPAALFHFIDIVVVDAVIVLIFHLVTDNRLGILRGGGVVDSEVSWAGKRNAVLSQVLFIGGDEAPDVVSGTGNAVVDVKEEGCKCFFQTSDAVVDRLPLDGDEFVQHLSEGKFDLFGNHGDLVAGEGGC